MIILIVLNKFEYVIVFICLNKQFLDVLEILRQRQWILKDFLRGCEFNYSLIFYVNMYMRLFDFVLIIDLCV